MKTTKFRGFTVYKLLNNNNMNLAGLLNYYAQ